MAPPLDKTNVPRFVDKWNKLCLRSDKHRRCRAVHHTSHRSDSDKDVRFMKAFRRTHTTPVRIAVKSQGRAVQVGAPREIYARPQTKFIGNSNFIEATVTTS